MKTFNIGRTGDQPFTIAKEKERVSGLHARITIDDQGHWFLEDLNSANGTFIMNEQGDLVEIRKKQISEFTRIVLADITPMGYSFYAHHILEQDSNNYRTEFAYLVNLHRTLKDNYNKLESSIKQRKVFMSLIPVASSSIIAVVLRIIFRNNPNITYMIIGMMSVVTAGLNVMITWFTNKDTSLKEHAQKMQRMIVCPKCGRPLSDYDISNQICPACKSHA